MQFLVSTGRQDEFRLVDVGGSMRTASVSPWSMCTNSGSLHHFS